MRSELASRTRQLEALRMQSTQGQFATAWQHEPPPKSPEPSKRPPRSPSPQSQASFSGPPSPRSPPGSPSRDNVRNGLSAGALRNWDNVPAKEVSSHIEDSISTAMTARSRWRSPANRLHWASEPAAPLA